MCHVCRLMLQCARQPGLAAVWEQLMGFRGDEFYLRYWPQLTRRTFAEVLLMFEDAVPLGVKSRGRPLQLNPPGEFVLSEGAVFHPKVPPSGVSKLGACRTFGAAARLSSSLCCSESCVLQLKNSGRLSLCEGLPSLPACVVKKMECMT